MDRVGMHARYDPSNGALRLLHMLQFQSPYRYRPQHPVQHRYRPQDLGLACLVAEAECRPTVGEGAVL